MRISIFVTIPFALMPLYALAQDADEKITWSLDPHTEKFPCDAAIISLNSMRFLKTFSVTCNGGVVFSAAHGVALINYVSIACKESGREMLVGLKALQESPTNLLFVAQNDCKTH